MRDLKKLIESGAGLEAVLEAGISKNYSKDQWEVIAYSLALIEAELPPKERKIAQRILVDLQKQSIWGQISEATFNSKNHVATFVGGGDTAEVYKQGSKFYAVVSGMVDYDMEANSAAEMLKKLKRDGLTKVLAGSLNEAGGWKPYDEDKVVWGKTVAKYKHMGKEKTGVVKGSTRDSQRKSYIIHIGNDPVESQDIIGIK